MKAHGLLIAVVAGVSAWGQLIPAGSSIPRRDKLPVVFLNGYAIDCSDSSFAGTFGIADQVMEASGRVSLYFNNCDFLDRQPIETLAAEFSSFLSNLKYEDGQPVDRVDVVAYSMGGLIVRSYLAGKQAAGGFNPPASVPIRKAVFVASPHFGTGLGQWLVRLVGDTVDTQIEQLTSGSRFLFDLATWNQGTDDLRGIDALSVIGNGGTSRATGVGFDDGVVSLTSGSLGWVLPGRTRVIPYCHTPGAGAIVWAGLCAFGAPSIVAVRNATDPQAQILLSFLDGTDEWKSVGTSGEADPLLSVRGGLIAELRSAADTALSITSIGAPMTVSSTTPQLAYSDSIPSGPLTLTAVSGEATLTAQTTIDAGAYRGYVIKPGPWINRIYPSASVVFPLAVAPGMFVSIYGEALASSADAATSVDFPTILADAQVLIDSAPAPLHYASPTQINAVVPEDATGLVKFEVRNGAGSHTVNVMVEPAVPAVFTQTGTGSGPASALNATNNLLVTGANPLRAGDYLQLYLTGLGATQTRDGLDWAITQPSVTIGGRECTVTYAGRAPGYRGLDQINCQVSPDLTPNAAAQLTVTSGNRSSTTATVAVQ